MLVEVTRGGLRRVAAPRAARAARRRRARRGRRRRRRRAGVRAVGAQAAAGGGDAARRASHGRPRRVALASASHDGEARARRTACGRCWPRPALRRARAAVPARPARGTGTRCSTWRAAGDGRRRSATTARASTRRWSRPASPTGGTSGPTSTRRTRCSRPRSAHELERAARRAGRGHVGRRLRRAGARRAAARRWPAAFAALTGARAGSLAARVAAAMRAHPRLVGGTGAAGQRADGRGRRPGLQGRRRGRVGGGAARTAGRSRPRSPTAPMRGLPPVLARRAARLGLRRARRAALGRRAGARRRPAGRRGRRRPSCASCSRSDRRPPAACVVALGGATSRSARPGTAR